MAIMSPDGIAGATHFFHPFMKLVTTGTVVTGRPWSTWALPGFPGAGGYDTTLNGVTLSSTGGLVTGQIPYYDPTGGKFSYLKNFTGIGHGQLVGRMLLCDRIWHNGGYTITSTSAQSSTTPTWPARDDNGTTNGAGVLLGLEISSNAGAAAPTITVTYTNSDGTGSRTGNFLFATANSPTANSFFPITLQAGDVGVRSLQSIQLSASWVSGTMNMVAYRVIATCEMVNSATPVETVIANGMPRIWDGSVPYVVFIPISANNGFLMGSLNYLQG